MKYYYKEDIYIENDSIYKILNDKTIKINKSNWHIHLKDLGWKKLYRDWVIFLNKFNDTNEKNSRYGIYNVPGDGDCFYHCLAYAMNENLGYIEYTSNDIRKLISDNIDLDMFETSIRYYKIMKDSDDFPESWDPYTITDINEYKNIICQSGNLYWLDYILLSHIIKILNINILILKDFDIYNTLLDFDINKSTIILLYENDDHFNLLGYFDGYIKTYLNTLPPEIKKLKKI